MINKFNNIPLYLQLKNIILERIENGEYQENTQIPSELELCEEYKISRPTVRQAINDLTNSGYLRKEKGRGTYVSGLKNLSYIKNYSGMKISILDSNEYFEDRDILSVKEINFLALPQDVQKYYIDSVTGTFVETIYKGPGMPDSNVSYSISYISTKLFPEILSHLKTQKPLFEIFNGKYPLIPEKCISNMQVCFAGDYDVYYLELQSGIPLFKLENVLYSKTGAVVEVIMTKYRADNTSFVLEFNK